MSLHSSNPILTLKELYRINYILGYLLSNIIEKSTVEILISVFLPFLLRQNLECRIFEAFVPLWQIGVAAALQKKEAAQKGSKLNLELTRICRAHRHNGPSILSSMLASFFFLVLFFFPSFQRALEAAAVLFC